jgi:nicotinamide-nucleotide amidase
MSGDTVDSNSSMIAQSLAAFGHGVAEKVTLGDDRARLVAALQRAAGTARILIMNGGLGPTQDDLTAELVAAAAASNWYCTPRPTSMCGTGARRAASNPTTPT